MKHQDPNCQYKQPGEWNCPKCFNYKLNEPTASQEKKKVPELNKIYNADCLEFMKTMPDKCVDLIVIDPPYGINLSKAYSTNKVRVFGDDGFSVMIFLDDILKEYQRILKPNSAIYIFTRFDVMPYWWLKCKNYFEMKNCIIWDKGAGGLGDLKGNYWNDYEMILFMVNGVHKLRGKRTGTVWNVPKGKIDFHVTQKPVDLIMKIIEKSSDVGDLVLDTFNGSGTTSLACIKTKRNYIGTEIGPEYVKIAEERIKNLPNELL